MAISSSSANSNQTTKQSIWPSRVHSRRCRLVFDMFSAQYWVSMDSSSNRNANSPISTDSVTHLKSTRARFSLVYGENGCRQSDNFSSRRWWALLSELDAYTLNVLLFLSSVNFLMKWLDSRSWAHSMAQRKTRAADGMTYSSVILHCYSRIVEYRCTNEN